MTIKIINGNLFATKCSTIVNTVNCVGVMGAGVALECRLRFPAMYQQYLNRVSDNKVKIGNLWLYKGKYRNVLNFPTKDHWRNPSKLQFLTAGLEYFLANYKQMEIDSIAFPLLGAGKGGIDANVSLDLMVNHLEQIDMNIEIYRYKADAIDDLFLKLRSEVFKMDLDELIKSSGISRNRLTLIIDTLKTNSSICQINQLARVKGIGIQTIEKLFKFIMSPSVSNQPLLTAKK